MKEKVLCYPVPAEGHPSRTDEADSLSVFAGMVYNVTPYMDYHPGGEEELMKAAGIDGTDLFDQVSVLCYMYSVLYFS